MFRLDLTVSLLFFFRRFERRYRAFGATRFDCVAADVPGLGADPGALRAAAASMKEPITVISAYSLDAAHRQALEQLASLDYRFRRTTAPLESRIPYSSLVEQMGLHRAPLHTHF